MCLHFDVLVNSPHSTEQIARIANGSRIMFVSKQDLVSNQFKSSFYLAHLYV